MPSILIFPSNLISATLNARFIKDTAKNWSFLVSSQVISQHKITQIKLFDGEKLEQRKFWKGLTALDLENRSVSDVWENSPPNPIPQEKSAPHWVAEAQPEKIHISLRPRNTNCQPCRSAANNLPHLLLLNTKQEIMPHASPSDQCWPQQQPPACPPVTARGSRTILSRQVQHQQVQCHCCFMLMIRVAASYPIDTKDHHNQL